MEAKDISLPVRIGVTTALAAATVAGAVVPEDKNVKTGAGVVGALATVAYGWWAFKSDVPSFDASSYAPDNKTLTAVGVGVAATGAIATAMYFLGGREAPKLPSFGELTGAAEKEIGFGSFESDLEKQRYRAAGAADKARLKYGNDPEKLRAVLDAIDRKLAAADRKAFEADRRRGETFETNLEKLRYRFAIASEKARSKYADDPAKLRAALDVIDLQRAVAERKAYARKGIGFGATATEYGDDY